MATVHNKWSHESRAKGYYYASNAFMWVSVDQMEEGCEWIASFKGDSGYQVDGTAESMAAAINAAKAAADAMLQNEVRIDL